MKKTTLENVVCIYNDNDEANLIGIIKRDAESSKHIIYLVEEAGTADIATLINPDHNTLIA